MLYENTGLVYFIQDACDPSIVKIGHTKKRSYANKSSGKHSMVEARRRELQLSCPHDLNIWFFLEADDPRDHERILHRMFRKYRKRGEWFCLPVNVRAWLDCIRQAVDTHGRFPRAWTDQALLHFFLPNNGVIVADNGLYLWYMHDAIHCNNCQALDSNWYVWARTDFYFFGVKAKSYRICRHCGHERLVASEWMPSGLYYTILLETLCDRLHLGFPNYLLEEGTRSNPHPRGSTPFSARPSPTIMEVDNAPSS